MKIFTLIYLIVFTNIISLFAEENPWLRFKISTEGYNCLSTSYSRWEKTIIDNRGSEWKTSRYGLFEFRNDSIYLWMAETLGTRGTFTTDLFLDSKNKMWVGFNRNDWAWSSCDDFNPNSIWNQWPPFEPVPISTKCGGGYGLATFNEGLWNIYDTSNSILPSNYINTIFEDHQGNLWVGTGYDDHNCGYLGSKGLVKITDQNWETFDSTNSNLPHNYIISIEQDAANDLWVDTPMGKVKFKPNSSIIPTVEVPRFKQNDQSIQINATAKTINYQVSNNSYIDLRIYNLSGQLVKKLFQGLQKKGNHEVPIILESKNMGVLFLYLGTDYGQYVTRFIHM